MPAGLSIMQLGIINITSSTTTISIAPSPGDGYCSDEIMVSITVNGIPNLPNTTITSTGTLPQSTISVNSTDGFPSNNGSFYIPALTSTIYYVAANKNVNGSNVQQDFFSGCSGGSGSLAVGQTVENLFQPYGVVYVKDLNTNTIPTGGVGTLSITAGQNNSTATLNLTLAAGVYNLVAYYAGTLGGDLIFNQFQPSQSSSILYLVQNVSTSIFISGASSFPAANPVTYTITVEANHGNQPSVGTVTLLAVQNGNSINVGSGTPSSGMISITIPGGTLTSGVSAALTASYVGTTCYYNGVSSTKTISPT